MPRPDLNQLQRKLLRSGVAPRHAHRTVVELDAHFDDLVDEALGNGADLAHAEYQAIRQLGDIDLLVNAVCARPELRSWASEYPRVALLAYLSRLSRSIAGSANHCRHSQCLLPGTLDSVCVT